MVFYHPVQYQHKSIYLIKNCRFTGLPIKDGFPNSPIVLIEKWSKNRSPGGSKFFSTYFFSQQTLIELFT